jgi:hypothetical protein
MGEEDEVMMNTDDKVGGAKGKKQRVSTYRE